MIPQAGLSAPKPNLPPQSAPKTIVSNPQPANAMSHRRTHMYYSIAHSHSLLLREMYQPVNPPSILHPPQPSHCPEALSTPFLCNRLRPARSPQRCPSVTRRLPTKNISKMSLPLKVIFLLSPYALFSSAVLNVVSARRPRCLAYAAGRGFVLFIWLGDGLRNSAVSTKPCYRTAP